MSVRIPMRSRPGSLPTSSDHGRDGDAAVYLSPAPRPAHASRIAAESRTECVSTCSCVIWPQYSPKSGPSVVRAYDGFSPTRPQNDAGIRIEPPMSLAWAAGTSPDATAAAEPPLDPAVERLR